MYLLLEHRDIINSNDIDDLAEVKSSTTCSDDNNKTSRPCTKRQRLLDDDDDEPRKIRFVPDEENVLHEIPSREELAEEHGVEWDRLYYQREDLKEMKRQAYLEVRIVELTSCDNEECTEDYFFHEIVVVDSKELQSIRIFLNGEPPSTGTSSLTCCLRGLEKRSSRYSADKKVRAKGLATVLMGQERLQHSQQQQQQGTITGTWRNWRNPTKETRTNADDVGSSMDLVAQLYKDVAMPSVEAAQQRAAYDELEAKAIYSSGVAQ